MRLGELADALNLELNGDRNLDITSLGPITSATSGQLSFVVSARFGKALQSTNASAVIVPAKLVGKAPCATLIADNPYLGYARASQLLYPYPILKPGIANTAIVHNTARVAPTASIGEHVVIGKQAVVGENTLIAAGSHIGDDASVGDHCQIHARVVIQHQCKLGNYCRVQSGAVIGADGFGYAPDKPGWVHIRQVGRVVIGDHVEIGANTTIDRGALDDTQIGDHVILDNQIQIGHNVRLGEGTALAACTGVAGSAVIGRYCQIGGMSAIVGHIEIADNVHLNANSFVTQSITEPGSYGSGMPLMPIRQWRRQFVRLTQLDDMGRQLRALIKSDKFRSDK